MCQHLVEVRLTSNWKDIGVSEVITVFWARRAGLLKNEGWSRSAHALVPRHSFNPANSKIFQIKLTIYLTKQVKYVWNPVSQEKSILGCMKVKGTHSAVSDDVTMLKLYILYIISEYWNIFKNKSRWMFHNKTYLITHLHFSFFIIL